MSAAELPHWTPEERESFFAAARDDSIAFSGLFTLLPAVIIHAILR